MTLAGIPNRALGGTTVRGDDPEPIGLVRLAALTAVSLSGLALAGCGNGDDSLTTGAAGPVATATTTTTAPTTTVSTIDFDRPVFQADAPLDGEAGVADVAALVRDLRGQTEDVDAQVRRLAPFPDLAGPAVAQITDVAVALAPAVADVHPSTARVRFRVPDDGPTTVDWLDDQFRALGWYQADQSRRSTDEATITDLVFRVPGRSADDLELAAVVEARAGHTVIDLEFRLRATPEEVDPGDGVTHFERLAAWQGPLPLPGTATLIEVGVETSAEAGAVTARYLLEATDEAQAVAAVVGAVGPDGFRLAGPDGAEAPTAGPLELVDDAGAVVVIEVTPSAEVGVFELRASSPFTLPPL
jgi:hypothetical protein